MLHPKNFIVIPGILTDRSRQRRPEWDSDDKIAERLSPESIAKVLFFYSFQHGDSVIMYYSQKAYLYLVNQEQSAWTWELDRTAIHFFLPLVETFNSDFFFDSSTCPREMVNCSPNFFKNLSSIYLS